MISSRPISEQRNDQQIKLRSTDNEIPPFRDQSNFTQTNTMSKDDHRYRAALPVMMIVVVTTIPNSRLLDALNGLLSLNLSLSSLQVCVITIASGILLLTASSATKGNNKGNLKKDTLQAFPSVQFMVEEPMSLSSRISHGNRAALYRVSSAAQMAKISSAASFARISEAVMHISVSKMCFQGFSQKEEQVHIVTVSASECFLSVDSISDMTLDDVSTIISYSIKNNRADFDEHLFYSSLKPYMQRVISDLDEAVMESRGMEARPARLVGPTRPGDIDALMFLAAMRIFVEWRVVRQVPQGYKAYAVGLSLARRDLIQNASKIEIAVHSWIDAQRKQVDGEVYSPTLRELLEYEVTTNVHTRLPRLKENSAALGLLWALRQIQYQTLIYENLLDVPHKFNAVKAVQSAYKQVFDPYHGWLIQKTFNYSFNGTPPVEDIYKIMNPRHLLEVMAIAQKPIVNELSTLTTYSNHSTSNTVETTLSTQSSFDEGYDTIFDDYSSQGCEIKQISNDEGNPLLQLGHHIELEWQKFTRNIQNGWDDFVSTLDPKKRLIRPSLSVPSNQVESSTKMARVISSCIVSLPTSSSNEISAPETRLVSLPTFQLEGDELDSYIESEMTKAAHNQFHMYLETMQPLLQDLSAIFIEFNMNDPTRV